ncbi:hypothetical protein evm_015273, partial [Chilo suppressalis]
MVVNACIAAAYRTARDYPANREAAPPQDLPPPVYNFVSSEQRPLTWREFMAYNEHYGLEVPPMQAMYYYIFTLTPSRFLYLFYCFLMHWIPAYIVDGVAVLIGKKPMLRKAYTKISKFADVLAYFATKQWKFYNTNVQNLYSELCDADKQIFDFDISNLDWTDYFYSYVRGLRVYLLKDPLETIPQGRTKHTRLMYLHYFCCTILSLIALRLLWVDANDVIRAALAAAAAACGPALVTSSAAACIASFGNQDINIMNSGVETLSPYSVGLILYATVNNTSSFNDYDVELKPEECCLNIDARDVCDVMFIEGECVETVPR